MRRLLSNGLFALLVAGLLGACATSRDTIVLLPKDDGSTGAIAASRGDAEILLDTAYASARPRLLGSKLKRDTADREKLDKRFGAALSAMPPPPKSFVVYFLSGSDDFTEESKSAIASMMDELKQRPSPEVTVIGHTDKVGGDDQNDALSLQRAGRMKELLVGMGVPADSIDSAGRGSREPLVDTAEGVDEPRNRRVEVNVR
jgi:outer membrane protein OmpA-like peptidoglycan-associated protein